VECKNCQEYGHQDILFTSNSLRSGDFHNSANRPVNKEGPKKKKCGNCQENYTANYRGCSIYKEMKDRRIPKICSLTGIRSRKYFRHGCKILIWSVQYPEVLLIRRWPSIRTENALQSNLGNIQQVPEQSQNTLEAIMVTMQQSMMELMFFMKTTMVIQLLTAKQSK